MLTRAMAKAHNKGGSDAEGGVVTQRESALQKTREVAAELPAGGNEETESSLGHPVITGSRAREETENQQ